MSNIYTKSMSRALQEARDYRDSSESNLKEIVGGQGEVTITQDDKTMIIKTKDWQTYKAKGWVKKTNESLDLSATGATTASSTSQELEEIVESIDDDTLIQIVESNGMGKLIVLDEDGNLANRDELLELAPLAALAAIARLAPAAVKVAKKAAPVIKKGISTAKDTISKVVKRLDNPKPQPKANLSKADRAAVIPSTTNTGHTLKFSKDLIQKQKGFQKNLKKGIKNEGEELTEAWNEKLSKKGLEQYRTMYKSLSKSGIDTKWIKALEKLYDDIVIGGMYSSRSAEREGILKIDGRTKYKNQNW